MVFSSTITFIQSMPIFIAIAVIFQLFSLGDAEGKFLKIENCTTTNKSLIIDRCDIINGSINVIAEIFRPLNQIFVNKLNKHYFCFDYSVCLKFFQIKLALYRREDSEFRPIGKFPVFEACALKRNRGKQNPFVAGALDLLKNASPEIAKPCPFTAKINITNYNPSSIMLKFVSRGLFRASFYFYNNEDKIIFLLNLIYAKNG